jgi:hypothetical protein
MTVEYVQLMASLPALGQILTAKTVPINRVRLQARLRRMLRPEHLAEINAASSLLAWRRQVLRTTDADFLRHARNVVPTLQSPMIRQIVHAWLEQRTVIAALRRRHAGQDAPSAREIWGFGRYVENIRMKWREPGFGLEHRLKWVLPAKEHLDKGEATGLERLMLDMGWRLTDRLKGAYDFNFEAVAVYVLRWSLVERWTSYDAEAAAARFDTLVTEALERAPDSFKKIADLMGALA